jgi:hypothetical protein
MQVKCHLAEFPHKAQLLPTLDRDEMDALVGAILKHSIPSTSTSIKTVVLSVSLLCSLFDIDTLTLINLNS